MYWQEKHSGVRAISNVHLNLELIIEYEGFFKIKSTWKSHDEKGNIAKYSFNTESCPHWSIGNRQMTIP